MKSIALKLWGAMMALVAIILILLWFFQIVFLDSFYTSMRINEIVKSGKDIITNIEDLQKVENRLDGLAYDNNLTAELIDADRNTLYTTGNAGMNGNMPMMMNSVRTEAYDRALKGQSVQLPFIHPRFNSKYMLIGLPVEASGTIEGALVITVPLVPVEDTAGILKKQLIYITLILVAATAILSFLLSKSFTRPILDIGKVAMDMASGNLSAKIRSHRKDEIGRLAETINYMGTELSKTERLRKDLVANVSHELRTPLSLIKGYAETIRDVTGSDEGKRNRQLGIIIEESDRLNDIVEDVLNLSQMQSGYMDLKMERFMVDELLDRLVKRFELLGEKTGVGIVRDGCGEAAVEGDEARIGQVLYNLINNAFNHSPEGSVIRIALNESTDKVKIEVTDSGEGIPPDELQNIWERFYKTDKSGKRKRAGTGLGLAIVKSILEAHSASFGVDSRPGSGSTFWFELKKA